MLAAHGGHTETVKELIDCGADISTTNIVSSEVDSHFFFSFTSTLINNRMETPLLC